MTWAEFWAAVLPPVLSLISVVITVLIGMAATALKNRANITIEQAHRDALHSAIMTGVQAAMRRAGPADLPKVAITETIKYVHQSVPDAVKALRPSDRVLFDLVEAKLTQAQAKVLGSPL